jgi:uncharacterized RDD family membrane protein YckC
MGQDSVPIGQDSFGGALSLGDSSSFSAPEALTAPVRARPAGEAAQSPQSAVRGRLNAIILDLLLLGAVTRLLQGALGESVRSTDALLLFLGLQFAYFFVCEAGSGRTVGKRIFHVRVATLSGAPPTGRQVAIRNVFRIVDALPIFYASGLLSIMRTGRARRQRIGDVVAGTTVVVDTGGTPLSTPRWLLPAATILTTVASIAVLLPILNHRRQPSVPVVRGFTGDSGQPPLEGSWIAAVTTTSSIGYSNESAHTKRFQITRHCGETGMCTLGITVEPPGESPISAPLIHRLDGWHATFPPRSNVCGSTGDGRPIYWLQASTLVFRFTDSGRFAEANERDFSQAPSCGYGTATSVWSARRL